MNIENLTSEQLLNIIQEYGLPIVWAVIILVLGRFAAKAITAVIGKALRRSKIDETLISFAKNVSYAGLMAFVIMAALEKLGIETTSFAALIGAAGLAIGFALQGSLSNFASGVMIMVFKPFKAGDFVDAGGVSGSVSEVQLFTTVLITPDNKKIIIPNGQITGGSITNFSAHDTRRIDMVVGVGYGENLKNVRTIIESILDDEAQVLKDPAYTIGVSELADSSVNFVVRPWVKTSDYWPVYFRLQETIKTRFDQENISIPFPQRDIHIVSGNVA